MKYKNFFKTCSTLLLLFMVFEKIPFKQEIVEAGGDIFITKDESLTENVATLRFGYDVTSGKPICEGIALNAPILKSFDDGLYKKITKQENNTSSVAGNYRASSAISVAEQSGTFLSGGIGGKISSVALDVDGKFDKTSGIENAVAEQYETYYQQINRKSYFIDSNVDLKDYLDEDFKNKIMNIKSIEEATNFISQYGTHLFTGLKYGGLIEVSNYMKTNQSDKNLSSFTSLNQKMQSSFEAIANVSQSFSFNEQYVSKETNQFTTSNYKLIMHGGASVSGMSLDQLFTYNPPTAFIEGGFIYDKWVKSINNGENMAIIGVPDKAKAIPLWELVPNSADAVVIKSHLINAYANLCNEKYNAYLEKYPALKSKITITDKEAEGTAEIKGYGLECKGNVKYIEIEEGSTDTNYVYKDSIVYINSNDNLNPEKKEWKITSGSAEMINNMQGIFKVSDKAKDGENIIVSLSNGSMLTFKVAKTKFSGGDGSEEYPFLISSVSDYEELCRNSNYWGYNFKLLNDIDLSGANISAIGSETNEFRGVFDGNYCKIKNVEFSNHDDGIGLFSHNAGTIKNLFVDSISISINENNNIYENIYIGGIAGYSSGIIENCKINNIDIECTYNADVSTSIFAGGLVGYLNGGTISTSAIDEVNKINVNINKNTTGLTNSVYLAGLIAKSGGDKPSTITNCYVKTIEKIYSFSQGKIAYSVSSGVLGFLDHGKTNISNTWIDDIKDINSEYDKTNWFNGYKKYAGFIADIAETKKVNENTEIKAQISIDNCYQKESINYKIYGEYGNDARITGKVIELDTPVTYDGTRLSSSIWGESNDGYPYILKHSLKENPLSIQTDNAKVEYYYGEDFNISGITLHGSFKSNDINEVIDVDTFSYDASAFDSKTFGEYKIIVRALGYESSYTVKVRPIKVIGISIEVNDIFYANEKFDSSNIVTYYILENGQKINTKDEKKSYIDYPGDGTIKFTEIKELALGDNKVSASIGHINEEFIISAEEKKVTGISIESNPVKEKYSVGEIFDTEGLVIKATYSDGSEKIVNNSELEIIGDKIIEGNNVVIISFDAYFTAEIEVTGFSNEYNVDWVVDGKIVETDIAKEGTIPQFDGVTPTKEPTAQYTYTFVGWDKDITPVKGSVTYTAIFKETVNKYTVTWTNENGTVLEIDNVEYGVIPQYDGSTPTKPSTDQYTYTFVGWDKEISIVKGNVTYKAKYREIINKYTVTWVVEGHTVESDSVDYGEIPQYNGPTPTKSSTNQYTYTFVGWDKNIVAVKGNITYTAKFKETINYYTVTWVVEGKTVKIDTLEYGAIPQYNGSTPTKPSTDQYTYTFVGWDKTIQAVTGNIVYTAVFTNKDNIYLVKWSVNGNIIETDPVEYGAIPQYNGPTPTKPSTEQYTYTFIGWDKEIAAVTGDITYTAKFEEIIKKYTVTWKNEDGTVLEIDSVEYGTTPKYDGVTPTKESTTEATFTFKGWDKEISAVTGDVTYTAKFETTQNGYTVTWKNEDGTVLEIDSVEYGTTPKYDGATPIKESTTQYTYTFVGWDKEIAAVTGNVTYTAKFEEIIKKYTVTWKNEDGTVLEIDSVEYGTTPKYDGVIPTKESTTEATFTFKGWDKEISIVTGDVTYIAVFNRESNIDSNEHSELYKELLRKLNSIVEVSLDSYDTLVYVNNNISNLSKEEADEISQKINPLIEEYNGLVHKINNEFKDASKIEEILFFGLSSLISLLAVVARLLKKGKVM